MRLTVLLSVFQEERLKIDQEEAEYQAKQRKEAIDRAKTLLYYQTDRVKGFHVRAIVLTLCSLDM